MASKTIKIGDKVRSFDFAMGDYGRDIHGERACYVDGIVIAIGDSPGCATNCPHYHIEVGRDVFGGIEQMHRVGDIVYPPVHADFGKRSGVEVATTPPAACNRCEGWTEFGGMSQHADDTEIVSGRHGCSCNR